MTTTMQYSTPRLIVKPLDGTIRAMDDGATPLGRLLAARMRARGWTQTETARRSGVPQSYISSIVRGRLGIPGEHRAAPLRAALDITRDEWYVAAGLIEPAPADEAWTADDVPAPDDPLAGLAAAEVARVVAYVEAKPGQQYRARLARLKAQLAPADYARFCVEASVAWDGSLGLALAAFEAGRRR